MNKKRQLGGMTPHRFLQRHWQKVPLLIRSAFEPGNWILDLDDLIELSQDPLCSSRLVVKNRSAYRVTYGPFKKSDFRHLPEDSWTFLVQGVNYVNRHVNELLDHFSFIPYARLDDVMISYSTRGGGVGPHYDSYDVFLLQGKGPKKWQVSDQTNLELQPDSDLKLLRDFQPTGSCQLEDGDMLYLPPKFSHNGIASEESLTYSIGFDALKFNQIKSEFLSFIDEKIKLKGIFTDPDRQPTNEPAHIPVDLIHQIENQLGHIKWKKKDIFLFLGELITAKNTHLVETRAKKTTKRTFQSQLEKTSFVLHPAIKLLYFDKYAFIGGETIALKDSDIYSFRSFANDRIVNGRHLDPNSLFVQKLYEWFESGFIEICDK